MGTGKLTNQEVKKKERDSKANVQHLISVLMEPVMEFKGKQRHLRYSSAGAGQSTLNRIPHEGSHAFPLHSVCSVVHLIAIQNQIPSD